MKNIFYILLLLPTIIFAQYPTNGNQKITLGEQTTADGLIFRGVAATDTVRKPSIDTMAYIILDTATNIQWHYKKATSNAWLRVGGSITSGLTGVLPLANGGTGSATQNFVDLTTTQSIAGAKTFTSAVTATRFNPTATTVTGNGMYLPAANSLGFSTADVNRMTINSSGFIGINGATISDGNNMSILSNVNGFNLFLDKTAGFGAVMQMRNTSANSTGLFRVINAANSIISEYTPTANGINFSIGNVGFNSKTTSAFLQLGSGTSSTAPLKFTSGTNLLTSIEEGAVEFSLVNGANRLYISPNSSTRKEIGYADLSNVSGVLPVANGGTGASSLSPNNYLIRTNSSGIFDTSAVYEANGRVGIGTTTPGALLDLDGNYTSGGLSALNMTKTGVPKDSASFTLTNATTAVGIFLPIFQIISNFVAAGNAIGFVFSGRPQEDNSTTDVGIRIDARRKDNTAMTTGAIIEFTNINSALMRIMANGNVGIGVAAPTEKLHVVGNARISSLAGTGSRTVLADANGVLSAPVSTINSKENVNAISYGLNDVLKLKPVSFNFIDKYKWGERLELGFIVEDMFPVIPEVTGIVDGQLLYLDMVKLIPVLTKAIQEQNNLIKSLEQRIINLENK